MLRLDYGHRVSRSLLTAIVLLIVAFGVFSNGGAVNRVSGARPAAAIEARVTQAV